MVGEVVLVVVMNDGAVNVVVHVAVDIVVALFSDMICADGCGKIRGYRSHVAYTMSEQRGVHDQRASVCAQSNT